MVIENNIDIVFKQTVSFCIYTQYINALYAEKQRPVPVFVH